MCGIVGYVGKKSTVEMLLNGLSKLEYRGYDSAGVALNSINSIKVFKAEGKLGNLKALLAKESSESIRANSGIGHIRWATHGSPNQKNAHPHTCNCGNLVIVHNGIIENFQELKEELVQKGCIFKSQTDTETVAHLIAFEYESCKDLKKAVVNSLKKLKGAYALCVMHNDVAGEIIVAKKNAPLILGLGIGENYIASDIPALIEYTKRAIYLEDDQIGVIEADKVSVYDRNGNLVDTKIETLPWESQAISKMGYKHFMLKEIFEQPDVIRNVLLSRIKDVKKPIVLNEVKFDKEKFKKLNRIQIIACGTSLHAALVGKYAIEELAKIPVDVEASSEYIYRQTIADENTLTIGVSQSGETADTLSAIRQAKKTGSHILIITNRPDSTMAREADSLIPITAGIEVSVAATKSYIAQLISFYLLAMYIAQIKESTSHSRLTELKKEMITLPQKVETILSTKDEIKKYARIWAKYGNFIYIARGINYATALEGSLKLKEISYINAVGYAAGELKHGPIAMLDENMPVLSILMPGKVYDKLISNCEEAKARDAKLIALSSSINKQDEKLFDTIIKVPKVDEFFSPVITIIPLQLFAYYIAEFLGKDVDQPRNLAKSVTVE